MPHVHAVYNRLYGRQKYFKSFIANPYLRVYKTVLAKQENIFIRKNRKKDPAAMPRTL